MLKNFLNSKTLKTINFKYFSYYNDFSLHVYILIDLLDLRLRNTVRMLPEDHGVIRVIPRQID